MGDIGNNIVSDMTVFTKYAKYIEPLQRREDWNEIVERNKSMHKTRFPYLHDKIDYYYDNFVLPKKVLPAMRSLQFAGEAIFSNNARIYNCAYAPIDSHHSFGELCFLLLSGCGIGYSVEKTYINKLPVLNLSSSYYDHDIEDTIEGWADAIKAIMGYFLGENAYPVFNYANIRQKGSRLVTSGGKAPGPEPLRECIERINIYLSKYSTGYQLTSFDIHLVCCYIADAVLSGGIRRAAMICFFDIDDELMLKAKHGNWFDNPVTSALQRANNSAVGFVETMTREDFSNYWSMLKASNSGEPGIFLTRSKTQRGNPCVEIGLDPHQMCNLVEINTSTVTDQESFNARCEAASFIATLQASYTNFPYLRPIWKETVENGALIGVGLTGIAANRLTDIDLTLGAEIVKNTNQLVAKLIGINIAHRCTTVKPAGTSSLLLSEEETVSNGIHSYYAPYYYKRYRFNNNESIVGYFKEFFPEFIEDEIKKEGISSVVKIPLKAPVGPNVSFRNEPVAVLLERIKRFNTEWVHAGHRQGENKNNVSCTVDIKEDEWDFVHDWMWDNKDFYHGIACYPYSGASYKQPPLEEITEEEYNLVTEILRSRTFNLSSIVEDTDETHIIEEIACAGGSCELTY